MKEFEKWQARREIKTIGYLNNSSAYNAGIDNRPYEEYRIKKYYLGD